MLQLPNLISLLRLFAGPFAAWLLYRAHYREALALLFAAGVTDWLDGWLARRLHLASRLGVLLDPIADKVLVVSVFITLGLLELIPAWLFLLVILRDMVIVGGALLLRSLRGYSEFKPSVLGKVSTFFQIALSLAAVLYAAEPYPAAAWLKGAAIILATVFTLLSGLDYVRQGILMARTSAPEDDKAK